MRGRVHANDVRRGGATRPRLSPVDDRGRSGFRIGALALAIASLVAVGCGDDPEAEQTVASPPVTIATEETPVTSADDAERDRRGSDSNGPGPGEKRRDRSDGGEQGRATETGTPTPGSTAPPDGGEVVELPPAPSSGNGSPQPPDRGNPKPAPKTQSGDGTIPP